jgi:hypothetical protein
MFNPMKRGERNLTYVVGTEPQTLATQVSRRTMFTQEMWSFIFSPDQLFKDSIEGDRIQSHHI